jgi:glycosyltransferase involved in cell wall biosynthesis
VIATSRDSGGREARPAATAAPPLVTVVVPVFNGGDEIVDNVSVIRRSIEDGLPGEKVELVVVSDGSIDGTAERLLEASSGERLRVIHYDRNLGKGYAVKLGALAARGDWVALVDADLDLDPGAIPGYLEVARREGLDFAIGSKRHPASVVHYPRSRRIASWCYQQLNRVLFRLDVRDTQVGLKVFRREVADEVVPLLLVKEFAFDLEFLAVARSLGFGRVRELPVRLDYRFSGSGVGSRAVARALWDTVAVFYRLRVLRTYRRKRELVGSTTHVDEPPLVSLIGEPAMAESLDYPRLEATEAGDPGTAVPGARARLLAILAPGARPAGNWVTAAVPYFSRPDVAAVVVPTLAPPTASLRERAAAAVLESHLGGGSRRTRHFPGNVRVVTDHPAETVVIRRDDYASALHGGIDAESLVGWLSERGRLTVYTPDTIVTAAPEPLFVPHLQSTIRHAQSRGGAARRTQGSSLSRETALSLTPAACAALGLVLVGTDAAGWRRTGVGLCGGYLAVIGVSAALAGLRFHSARVGLLAAPALVATQAAYVVGFVGGLIGRASSGGSGPRPAQSAPLGSGGERA